MTKFNSADAQFLLDNELLKQSFEKLERSAVERMINADILDHELRQGLALQVRAIRALHGDLKAMIATSTPRDKGTFA